MITHFKHPFLKTTYPKNMKKKQSRCLYTTFRDQSTLYIDICLNKIAHLTELNALLTASVTLALFTEIDSCAPQLHELSPLFLRKHP